MISNLFNKNIVKILALFLISPGSKHTRREIKEKTKMNNVPLDGALNKLIKSSIIKKEKNLLMLNPGESDEIKGLRDYILFDYREILNFLPLRIFYIILDISDKLSEIKNIKETYLFGSYSKLIYSEKSDIDLAIIFPDKIKEKRRVEQKILREINKIKKRHKKKIEIHFFSASDMKHKKDPLIKDILRNGGKIL